MSLFQSLDSIETIESAPIGVSFTTIEYTNISFLENIKNGKLSDIKIRDTIKYGNYLDYDNFNNAKTRVIFQELWSNLRFLNNLLYLLNTNEEFLNKARSMYITSINKIVYDYYTTDESDGRLKDSEVLDSLLRIAYVVDHKYILRLTPLVGQNTAGFIALGKFSSFDKRKCVERLNRFIVQLGYNFSINDIIKIYGVFYLDNFTDLFINTMFDTLSDLTNEQRALYDNISLAILYILEDMPSSEIAKVLRAYSSNIMLLNNDKKLRFSLKNLAESFNKVNNVVLDLEYRGYSIP